MGSTKRAFESVKRLRNLNPQVLRDLLMLFPDYVKSEGLTLPKVATDENLDYEAIRQACIGRDIPAELDDILFLSSLLGKTAHGWELVKLEAQARKVTLDAGAPDWTYVDLAIRAATKDWPKNQELLEHANARARADGKSSYMYYAPSRDLRAAYTRPGEKKLLWASEQLTEHLVGEGLIERPSNGPAARVVMWEHESETWFLIRYPGRTQRHAGYDRDFDTKSFVFNPEEYDAIIYNRVYGDLRMNTCRVSAKEHTRYRILFSDVLFGESGSNAFKPTERVVSLEPLRAANAVELFNCGDIKGLGDIVPMEVCFRTVNGTRKITWAEETEKQSLLDHNKLKPRLLPDTCDAVDYAVFRYRLRDQLKWRRLVLRQIGSRVTYSRDGDSLVLEEWMRKRKLVRDVLGVVTA